MNIHLNLLQDRLALLRYEQHTKGCSAIIDAQVVDTLRAIEDVLGDSPLTVENAEAYCQRIVPEATALYSSCKLDCGQPIIDVWFRLDGVLNCMTVWVETNGRLYGEY